MEISAAGGQASLGGETLEQGAERPVQLKKLSPKHDAIMEWLLLNPERSFKECAGTFGVTQAWLSCIVHSDIFQARYQKLMGQNRDDRVMPLRQKMLGLAHASIDKLTEIQAVHADPDFQLDLATKMVKGLGFGAPTPASLTVTNNIGFVSSVSPEELLAAREVYRKFQQRLAIDASPEAQLPAPPAIEEPPVE